MKISIHDIFFFSGFWQVTVPDHTDIKLLPSRIASSPAFYRTVSEAVDPDPAALRHKSPEGIQYDDTVYATAPNALLRPGIMLSSSLRTIIKDGQHEETFKTTTSGILVANEKGEIFITVATRGSEQDGLIYHPKPTNGQVIGMVIKDLPGTDISVARLNAGLRYINETFGTAAEPEGITMSGISPGDPPDLRVYDDLTMNNPFSGGCEGLTMAIGAKIPEEGE